MLLIFGEREYVHTRDTGTFFCQTCREWREYAYLIRRFYFTLFFIRTFVPTSDPTEYVQCLSCSNAFDITALRYNPDNRPVASE